MRKHASHRSPYGLGLSSLLLAAFLLAGFGCSDSNNSSNPKQGSRIMGVVYTDGANGGLATILSSDKKALGEAAVYKLGGFIFDFLGAAPPLFSTEVQLVYQGMDCTYACDVENPEPDQIVYIGPVSTLIHAYRLAHPGVSFSEARSRILRFLDIDPTYSDYTIKVNPTIFSKEHFMESARVHGGFNEFLAYLLTELEQGRGPCRFKEDPDPDSDILDKLMENLQENLEDAAIDDATGWILNFIGGGGSGSSSDIENLLNEQIAMLSEIETEIMQLSEELEEVLNTVLTAVDRANYNNVVTALDTPIANILTIYQKLDAWATMTPSESNRQNLVTWAKSWVDDIQQNFNTIYLTMLNEAGGEGALSLYSRIIFKMSDTFTLDEYTEAVSNQFAYYFGYQLKALQLIVEAYHVYDPPQIDVLKSLYDQLMAELRTELALFNSHIPITEFDKSTDVSGALHFTANNDVLVLENPNVVVFDGETLDQKGQFSNPYPDFPLAGAASDGKYLYTAGTNSADIMLVKSPLNQLGGPFDFHQYTVAYGFVQLAANEKWICMVLGSKEQNWHVMVINNDASLESVATHYAGDGDNDINTKAIVTLDGDYAYVFVSTYNSSYEVISYIKVLDLQTQAFVQTLNLPGTFNAGPYPSMIVKGDTLCIGSGSEYVWMIDVNDQTNLTVQQSLIYGDDYGDLSTNKVNFTYDATFGPGTNFIYVSGRTPANESKNYVYYNNPFYLSPSMDQNKENFSYPVTWNYEPIAIIGSDSMFTIGLNDWDLPATLNRYTRKVVVTIPQE